VSFPATISHAQRLNYGTIAHAILSIRPKITFPCAVLNIGDRDFALGLTYVAISQVKYCESKEREY
jgi:hypothetical protein